MLNCITVSLDQLVDAPWRFTVDLANDRSLDRRQNEAAHENIQSSLETHGQLSPIHVCPLAGRPGYLILDGHVVVDCAKQAGFKFLEAVVHDGLSGMDAHKRYIYFNRTLASRYHVKMMRDFQALYPRATQEERDAAVAELLTLTSWEDWRLQAYIELDEQSMSWRWWSFDMDEDEKKEMSEADWKQMRVSDWQ